MSDVEHLVCSQCEETIGVAQIDSVTHLVCHCTHVDGSIDPVAIEDVTSIAPMIYTDEWYSIPEDAS